MSLDVYQILAFASPIAVAAASFCFGLATKRYDRRIKAAQERYDNLYVPFVKWIVRAPLNWLSPVHYSPKFRLELLNLLLDNAQYMGEESSKILMPLYDAHLKLDNFESEALPELARAPMAYTEEFQFMTVVLLAEATKVSKVLRLPDMAGTVYKSLDGNLTIGNNQLPKSLWPGTE